MARELKPIDITNVPELLRIVEEVQQTNQPRILKRDSEELAILMPIKTTNKRRRVRKRTEPDYEAFRSAAGSWADVDTDKFIEEIYENRTGSSRPPVEL